ncbi:Uncharacterized protein OBRU01_24641 [Operophtera brumata]|uniref:Dynein axonemal assembly factor 1 homolog n=1 Tax=Operophtera brumata TaxID=104452 RepID=A0A0L7KKW0_OPEBR|nr:Uncharacterized protein OBRU01_24641 [Operophtera brumata]
MPESLYVQIIHPTREPGVIDNAMLTRCILEYEGVHLDEAPIVRLEFQNILRIDHLWMLTSLTKLTLAHNLIERIENLELLKGLIELDLSFNKIEKIENLDKLINLEVVTFFQNKIRKLENMECLEKLLIFSIGNPCCDDPMAYAFLKSALVRVTYLDYMTVTQEEREDGQALFRGLLRKLDDADEKSEKERIAKEVYEAKVKFYALSFVEYLNGPELLDSMFVADLDGSLLLQVGGELLVNFEQYKEQYVETMAELIVFAQEAYTTRQNEIVLFKDLVENALADSVQKSKGVVAEFEKQKKPIIVQMNELINKFKSKQSTIEQLEPVIVELGDTYNDWPATLSARGATTKACGRCTSSRRCPSYWGTRLCWEMCHTSSLNNEVKRNRDRILEINYFLDNQREEWMDMQMGLTEAVDPETVALLGDDF